MEKKDYYYWVKEASTMTENKNNVHNRPNMEKNVILITKQHWCIGKYIADCQPNWAVK